MKIVTEEFTKTVENLIKNLKVDDVLDSEEFKLARKYNALPLGFDFIGFTFITSSGEVISQLLDDDDFGKSDDSQHLINALVYGKRRYPQLEQFIPSRSDESKTCPVCEGSGIWKHSKNTVTGEPGNCVICASQGWVTKEYWKDFTENQKKLKAEDKNA